MPAHEQTDGGVWAVLTGRLMVECGLLSRGLVTQSRGVVFLHGYFINLVSLVLRI